jgi:hypothetical protein
VKREELGEGFDPELTPRAPAGRPGIVRSQCAQWLVRRTLSGESACRDVRAPPAEVCSNHARRLLSGSRSTALLSSDGDRHQRRFTHSSFVRGGCWSNLPCPRISNSGPGMQLSRWRSGRSCAWLRSDRLRRPVATPARTHPHDAEESQHPHPALLNYAG